MAYVPGMPTNLPTEAKEKAQESYNKQQEKKNGGGTNTSNSSSTTTTTSTNISAPGIGSAGVPTNVQQNAQNQYDSQHSNSSSSNSYDTTKTTVPGMPSNIPSNVQQSAQQQYTQQQQSNASFIDTISNSSAVSIGATKLLKETNTAKAVVASNYAVRNDETFQSFIERQDIQNFDAEKVYEKLPTSEREKIKNMMQYKTSDERTASTYMNRMNEVYKIIQSEEAENKQRTLNEMMESRFWEAGEHQFVTYATAADYYKMNKIGYETVLIEDGNGTLDNKGGVFTIGRNKLSGVPKDVKTVMVDTEGNWRYIANTGSRANYVENMQNIQYANTLEYEKKFSQASHTEQFTRRKCEELEKEAKKLEAVASKTRKQSDWDAYQLVVDKLNEYNTYHKSAEDKIANIALAWSVKFDAYDKAINSTIRYTAEDEERYQALESAINNIAQNDIAITFNSSIVSDTRAQNIKDKQESYFSELLAEYADLKKRREESAHSAIFINKDTKAAMDEEVEIMQKAVDDYNLWDSSTIHIEKGEDLGNQIKRLFLRDMLGWGDTDEVMNLGDPTSTWTPTKRDIREADSSNFIEDIKGIGQSIVKTVSPFFAATKATQRAEDAYWDAESKKDEIKKLRDSGRISNEYATQMLNELSKNQFSYLAIQKDAFTQAGALTFSNVMSNLTIFDLRSVQSTVIAYQMAAHPERYSNDPKFKKMQDAFKAIYGTDYRGKMDAGKMAMAMIDIKANETDHGKALGSDYVYLDGSDLRYDSGEKYGFWSSLGVSMITDIGVVTNLAKLGVEAFAKVGGTKLLAKSATDSFVQSLTRSGVQQEAAEKAAKSLAVQATIRKDIYSSVKQSIKGNGDNLGKVVGEQMNQRASMFEKLFVDDVTKSLDDIHYANFVDDLSKTLAKTQSLADRSLLINKSTVIAKTLGGIDDMLDKAERTIFAASCPVVGAVVSVYKGNKFIKELKNLKLADADTLEKMFISGDQVKAIIDGMDFNSCLDGVGFRKMQEDMLDEFNWAAMSDIKHKLAYGKSYKETIQRFSDYKDMVMRGVADSYVSNVSNTLVKTMDGSHGLEDLEKLAQQHEFETFEDMYAVIKENIEPMYQFSGEAKGIMDAFDNAYQTKIIQKKLGQIKDYVEAAESHVDCVTAVLNSKNISVLTPLNAKMYPDLVQGTSKMISNAIHDFLYTVNNDFITYADRLGNPVSLHEIGVHAIDTLDDVAYGAVDAESLAKARDAVQEYVDELNDTYIKNLRDWKANALQDALGQQDYLKGITKITPEYAGSRQVLDQVHTGIIDYFEKKGLKISEDDVREILVTNENALGKELAKLPEEQRSATLYRIMENKGAQIIGQISDSNMKMLTDALTDCNSQLTKNLKILQDQLDNMATKQRVTDAIVNACGINNTRIISDAMKYAKVDGTMYMSVMDVLAGHSNEINRIIQSESVDVAVVKCKDYIMREVSNQLALHNGTYETFRKMVGETVDVGTNVRYMEKWLDGYVPAEEDCIDICVSILKPTDGAAPKDIAFHVRGASGNPTVFRKSGNFAVFDNGFSSRAYGKNAQQLTEEYARLGVTDGLTPDEWRHQLAAYINTQKELALKENKTLRFIGFNSSDAITGNNKWLSETLRSCGVNANMANAVDLADAMRSKFGEYVFDSAHIEALSQGLRSSIITAKAQNTALGIGTTVAYDPKYNCADIIKGAFKNHQFTDEVTESHAKYIIDSLDAIDSNLGTKAYNEVGDVLGAYIDATALSRKLADYGITRGVHAGSDIMKIISEATAKGEPQLGIHKIIDTATDEQWVDLSKINSTGLKYFGDSEKVHGSVLQLNSMFDSLHRTDLITDADKKSLQYIYKEIATSMPMTEHAAYMLRIFKVDELSTQQLYVVNKWLLDNLHKANPAKFDKLYGRIIINAPKQASYLSDVGYTFVRSNVIDYTDETLDAFFVKYLDDSEESFRFAQDLEQIKSWKQSESTLKNYTDALEGLFAKYNIHGVQDRMVIMQMAEVHRPITLYRDTMKKVYKDAYNAAVQELAKEAKQFGKRARYNKEMVQKIATERGVRAAKKYIIDTSDTFRKSSVQVVANLNADAFKAHLVRNCCGGMIIDPSAKCVQGLDLPLLFERWQSYGVKIDTIDFSNDIIKNRKLFRISLPELDEMGADEIFAKYNNAHVKFVNPTTAPFANMRHMSFGASDGTLMNAEHQKAFKELFFGDEGTLCDLNQNFRSWRNELYSCNMWTDMDLKQLVNPYYTDNLLNNMAQNTHQLRDNIMAVHDMSTIMNNHYMNTGNILSRSGVLDNKIPIAEQRQKIIDQLDLQKQRLCVISVDSNNKFKLIDYTPRLKKASTDDDFFKAIIDNTIMVDESMYAELASWSKATNVALKLQASSAPEWLVNAYNTYKKTIRNATITLYLYGNLGTAVRNYMDSSTKGLAETIQYDESVISYIKKYMSAVNDVHKYSNTYRCIEDTLGRVNRETITKYFAGNIDDMNKFNIFYGYERTCGESIVEELSRKDARRQSIEHFTKDTNITSERADQIRRNIDAVYGSRKYYSMTNAQLEKHAMEIHDACMKRLREQLNLDEDTLKVVSEKFWDYTPTVDTWGDKLCKVPLLGNVLSFNRARFNNAETRARLAVFQTFLEGGASEFEAMQHVNATQFHYAGIGKVEDFMPFTQYKLYNALYWFDHANMNTVATAWRAAQTNGDGSLTNQEIAAMITKYRTAEYNLFDRGRDAAYDNYYDRKLSISEHILTDGVDSYLGVPRDFNMGNLDLTDTHYLKLGNSFVEEIDMVLSCAAGAYLFGTTIGRVGKAKSSDDKIRLAYESLRYTPLYDSFYSPWKSYFDFMAFSYDYKKMNNAKDNRNSFEIIKDNYKEFLAYKSTHSEAIAMLPVIGTVIDNIVKRKKSFDLNKGELMALMADPYARQNMLSFITDVTLDTAGMLIPSVIGTKVERGTQLYPYTYAPTMLRDMLVEDPATYFDIMGRLQRDMGFTPEQAQTIWESMTSEWYPKSPGYNGMPSNIAQLYDSVNLHSSYKSKLDYYHIAVDLYTRGYNTTEITNLFKQHNLPEVDTQRFKFLKQAMPNYLQYDKNLRDEIISRYKAMGMSADQAWSKLITHPAIIRNGKIVELTPNQSAQLSKKHNDAYYALKNDNLTDEQWKAYLDSMPFRYPKGKWSETYKYLTGAGYTKEEARKLLLDGFMLDDNGRLVDVQGVARANTYSYSTLKSAEWDAHWAAVPDYTKYEKGAYKRTMKSLKGMGYDDATARALIQQGVYVAKDGTMMNVTGMQHPVLGFPNFNAYYQTIPEYCRYEKGAFKRTYAALKNLGFDYDTSLTLIQQGAYLMDMTGAPSIVANALAQPALGLDIKVTDINTLLQKYGNTVITGADGKAYMIVNCSGLQRPRKTFSYSRSGSRGGRRSRAMDRMYRAGGGGSSKGKKRFGRGIKPYKARSYKIPKQYITRAPYVEQNNVSTYKGFTNYRGSTKLSKPYTTQGYVSTYSKQNFLDGASYGMRKAYKIDMRQYKTGALSTKSAYPASYRNIAVAYRRNLYKDLYAKYGASRMRMRSNLQGYSNASIVRLRRNEIANRERYAERRDLISKRFSGRAKKKSQ